MYFLISGKVVGIPGKHFFAIRADDKAQADKNLRRTRPDLKGVRFEAWKITVDEDWFSYGPDKEAQPCPVKSLS